MSTTSPTRVIVIGGGLSGLAVAKTYLRVSRTLDRPIALTVLDAQPSVGGVWATARLYPGLFANDPTGFYELSDKSMVDEQFPYLSPIPGEHIRDYLETYAQQSNLLEHMRFNARVQRVWRGPGGGWCVKLEGSAGGDTEPEVLECDKLVVAAGLFNKPETPSVPAASYTGEAIHSRDLHARHAAISADAEVRSVVVVGGCKSAIEAVSIFATAGKRVTWVVRPSPRGVPIIVGDAGEAAHTRAFAAFAPSVFALGGSAHAFLHSGRWWLGVVLVRLFWALAAIGMKQGLGYRKSRNGRAIEPLVERLAYDVSCISFVSKDSPFLELLHADDDSRLKVCRANVRRLEGRSMVVETEEGEEAILPADAVVFCTGWKSSIDFFDRNEALRLGLPVEVTGAGAEKSSTATAKHATRVAPSVDDPLLPPSSADAAVQTLFPHELRRTRPAQPPVPYTRFGLFRQTIPTAHYASQDRSIAFIGMFATISTAICSELTSLWAVAWLEDLFVHAPMPLTMDRHGLGRFVPEEYAQGSTSGGGNGGAGSGTERERRLKRLADAEVDLVCAMMSRRYSARTRIAPEIIFEAQTFVDLLCRDLGVQVERKKTAGTGMWRAVGNWYRELFEPYRAKDYAGVVDEFLAIRKEQMEGTRSQVDSAQR